MKCRSCGHENPDDAHFCQKCGTSMGEPRSAPMFTKGGKVWWYPIGVWAILSAFFLFIDAAASGAITWSVWPVGI